MGSARVPKQPRRAPQLPSLVQDVAGCIQSPFALIPAFLTQVCTSFFMSSSAKVARVGESKSPFLPLRLVRFDLEIRDISPLKSESPAVATLMTTRILNALVLEGIYACPCRGRKP